MFQQYLLDLKWDFTDVMGDIAHYQQILSIKSHLEDFT